MNPTVIGIDVSLATIDAYMITAFPEAQCGIQSQKVRLTPCTKRAFLSIGYFLPTNIQKASEIEG